MKTTALILSFVMGLSLLAPAMASLGSCCSNQVAEVKTCHDSLAESLDVKDNPSMPCEQCLLCCQCYTLSAAKSIDLVQTFSKQRPDLNTGHIKHRQFELFRPPIA